MYLCTKIHQTYFKQDMPAQKPRFQRPPSHGGSHRGSGHFGGEATTQDLVPREFHSHAVLVAPGHLATGGQK